MIKYIVTTTINPPSKALKLFAAKKDWNLIIVGDLITPHELFRKMESDYKNVSYLTPEDQDKKYYKLSKAIGYKKIQRRNIGYLEAYNLGAEIIATVDDDNIPYDKWGENLILGKEIDVNFYKCNLDVFDPIGATNTPNLWHRGYPLQLIPKRDYSNKVQRKVKVAVQADFWNGDPDIDAICRMEHSPEVKYDDKYFPLASNKISPFNSQNTFLKRDLIKNYFLFPFIGRMDDIWAGYYLQALGHKVVYSKASVYQARNEHDLVKDMKGEYLGYENNLSLVQQLQSNPEEISNFLPEEAMKAFEIYRNSF